MRTHDEVSHRNASGRIRWARSTLVALALAACAAAPASAQAVYGSVAGTVVDNSGGVLPGVTVTVTSVERKVVDSVVTDEVGRFVKERLLPGTYEVKAELAGFKTAVVAKVIVAVDTQTPRRSSRSRSAT